MLLCFYHLVFITLPVACLGSNCKIKYELAGFVHCIAVVARSKPSFEPPAYVFVRYTGGLTAGSAVAQNGFRHQLQTPAIFQLFRSSPAPPQKGA